MEPSGDGGTVGGSEAAASKCPPLLKPAVGGIPNGATYPVRSQTRWPESLNTLCTHYANGRVCWNIGPTSYKCEELSLQAWQPLKGHDMT